MPTHEGKYIVDNSTLEEVATCSTRFCMSTVLGLKAREGKATRDAGKVCHRVLMRHFQGMQVKENMDIFDGEYAPVDALLPEERLMHNNVRTIMTQWCERNALAKLPYEPIVADLERGLKVPLMDGVDFFALVDAPVIDRETGEYVPLDHKTTGKINAWWTRKFRLTSQQDGYIWAVGVYYQRPCSKTYINAIELNKLPDPVKKKCRTHGLPYEECYTMHCNWQLIHTTRTPEMLEEWRQSAIFQVKRAMELERWFNNIALISLVRMQGKFNGGCVFCDYSEWCRNGRQIGMAEEMFIQEPWEPWKERR